MAVALRPRYILPGGVASCTAFMAAPFMAAALVPCSAALSPLVGFCNAAAELVVVCEVNVVEVEAVQNAFLLDLPGKSLDLPLNIQCDIGAARFLLRAAYQRPQRRLVAHDTRQVLFR